MATSGWGWDRNYIKRGIITASSQVVGMTVDNLQNDHGDPSLAWQTVGTTANFTVDCREDVIWRALVLARTNLTPEARIRWRVGPRADFSTWYWDSGNLPGPEPGTGQNVSILPPRGGVRVLTQEGVPILMESGASLLADVGVGGRYLRCDISDPRNPDGYLNVPLAYAGPLVHTRHRYGYGSSISRTQGSSEVRTRSGATFPRLDWTARTREIDMPLITAEEVWDLVMAVDLYARRGGNVLYVPNPEATTLQLGRETIFGRLTPTAPVSYANRSNLRRAWRATIEERL